MIESHEHTDDPLSQILPSGELSHAPSEPPLSEFKPWHLPRKQYLRIHQWSASLRHLLDEIPDNLLVKYLCLPGEDLIDVQLLANVCREKNRRFRYLGFDQSVNGHRQSIQRLASEQIIRQSECIEVSSQVLSHDFTSIARDNSLGHRALCNGGSYDVVNLDLCDAFTTHGSSPTHEAIRKLLAHQSNRRADPWLLFLTTRTEVKRLQEIELNTYADRIRSNAMNSEDFRKHLSNIAGLHYECEPAPMLEKIYNQLESNTYLSGRWLAIGIGKWLLGIMGSPDPWRLDLLSVYCYRTGLLSGNGAEHANEPPNMFSLVFKFKKIDQAL